MKTKQETIFFSTTNVSSQRYIFFVEYFKNNSIYLNLMSSNKLSSVLRNTIFYGILFLPSFTYLFFKLILKDLRKIKNIIIPFPGILDVVFLYPFCKLFNINIIYDAFVNFEQTLVDDRKLIKTIFLKSLINRIDTLYISLCDYLIVETIQIKKFYIDKYKINESKIIVLLSPREVKYDDLIDLKFEQDTVLYFGSYVPLNGTEYIIKAANMLKEKNIKFLMIGDGQDKPKCLDLVQKYKLKNIEFLDTLPFNSIEPEKSLQNYIHSCSISLGTFSTSLKNNQVIPGKIVDALACGKIVITSTNECVDYYLKDSVIKIQSGSPEELAKKITDVVETNQFDHISKAALNIYSLLFSREVFESKIVDELEKL